MAKKYRVPSFFLNSFRRFDQQKINSPSGIISAYGTIVLRLRSTYGSYSFFRALVLSYEHSILYFGILRNPTLNVVRTVYSERQVKLASHTSFDIHSEISTKNIIIIYSLFTIGNYSSWYVHHVHLDNGLQYMANPMSSHIFYFC